MKLGGWQEISLNDYPGKISTMIFTTGCNFRCKYCHNPELVLIDQYPVPLSIDDFFAFLKQYKGKIDAVTISGGEPTMQKDLAEFLTAIKKLSYLVKLDTNGTFPAKIAELIKHKLVDYIAMDIKAPLDKYQTTVGISVPKEVLQTSIKLIMNSDIDYEFRTTIAKSLLSLQDVLTIAKTIQGASRYYLQQFRPGKTICPELDQKETYTENELLTILPQIKKWIKVCEIR